MTDFLHDYPAHPTGIVVHPEWPSVRDRWNALYCNRIVNEARERDEEREPSNFGIGVAIIAVLMVGLSMIASIQT